METKFSPSENAPTSALPSCTPTSLQMASAKGRLEVPEKILISLPCAIMFYILSISLYSTYFHALIPPAGGPLPAPICGLRASGGAAGGSIFPFSILYATIIPKCRRNCIVFFKKVHISFALGMIAQIPPVLSALSGYFASFPAAGARSVRPERPAFSPFPAKERNSSENLKVFPPRNVYTKCINSLHTLITLPRERSRDDD